MLSMCFVSVLIGGVGPVDSRLPDCHMDDATLQNPKFADGNSSDVSFVANVSEINKSSTRRNTIGKSYIENYLVLSI